MLKIITVCGNGIGSSLMLAQIIKKLVKEWNIEANISSSDLMSAKSETADLFITANRLASELDNKNVVIIRSYTNKTKVIEDIKEKIVNLSNQGR
ncbi:PTS sugar transporter subunit IIB [Vibrio sp. NTOU-M3]|uniref:PTS sugar transporter subunit IIB n=1 Tax=Vibrio sp. NTOU-M3 TaxID=3234954 RepID=UPI00349F9A2D